MIESMDAMNLFTAGEFRDGPVQDPVLALFTLGWFGSDAGSDNAVFFGTNF